MPGGAGEDGALHESGYQPRPVLFPEESFGPAARVARIKAIVRTAHPVQGRTRGMWRGRE